MRNWARPDDDEDEERISNMIILLPWTGVGDCIVLIVIPIKSVAYDDDDCGKNDAKKA